MTEPEFDAASWRPANEPELLMYHALLRRHTQRYFQIAAETTLYLPAVSTRLITWERGGRPHVLAFTSPEGVSTVVGREADTVLRVDHALLVRDWPDTEWWLALNPALPIEATLPVTDLGPAATGDVEIEMPPPPVVLGLPGAGLDDAPANEWEQHLAGALSIRNSALILDLLVLADVLLPTLRPVPGPALDDPYFPWAAMPLVPELPVDGPAIGVFTSASRLADATLGGSVPTTLMPLRDLARAWPGEEYTMLVNPHTSLEVRVPGSQVVALAEWAEVSALYYDRVPE